MRVVSRDEIREALDVSAAIDAIEQAFGAYANGDAVVPPVGQLDFEDPPGECHIKYGRLIDDDTFLIKVATGFYDNPKQGLPTSNGLMLLLCARTGRPLVMLQDNGFLTDVRTAIAGAISARYLAPQQPGTIGIVGAGAQARYQLRYLRHVCPCNDAIVWARNTEQAQRFAAEMTEEGFSVQVAPSVQALCENSRLIVTTTASREPLIMADWLQDGTHITAMGSDGAGKQELDPGIFARASLCVVDSPVQCSAYGEAHYALARGFVSAEELVPLGTVVSGAHPGRVDAQDITVADLTGVAVQDIAIASSIWSALAP